MAAEQVGFIGLGAMGAGIASNLQRGLQQAPQPLRLKVWNRTAAKATAHAAATGSDAVAELTDLAGCTVIVSCLPTSKEVRAAAGALVPELRTRPLPAGGVLWIDCTSGEPVSTRAISTEILAPAGVALVDCPVSGGPAGAASGQLTGSPQVL